MSKEEKIRASKLRKEVRLIGFHLRQEKLQKAALRAEEAEIDAKVVEGSVGGCLISRLAEKGIKYRIISNPIERSIVWTMSNPQDIAQVELDLSYSAKC
ncbi:unnamed protein product [Arabis nemorensis]|uniref:Uncharacterized protein n=1 Tax=Arabis nemorensis TaxID=586526 RepID=A0A565BNH9_9BRAS|nr:unnamed protein product [Arabis nemorensis]